MTQAKGKQGHNKGDKESKGQFKTVDPVVPVAPTAAPKLSSIQSSPVQSGSQKDLVGKAARNYDKNKVRDSLEYELSRASIIGMAPAGFRSISSRAGRLKGDVRSEIILAEIVAEFGQSAVSSKVKVIPIQIAQRLNHKYPSEWIEGERRPIPNPKAVKIAQRYMSLFGDKLKD